MKLASSLALKWLGGIAAVGGATGGAFMLHKSGYLSGGGNEDKGKGDDDLSSQNTTDTKKPTGERTAKTQESLPSNPKDVASNNTLPNDNQQSETDDIQITTSDEDLGIPLICEGDNGCELDKNGIEKIKFQALESGKGQVSVSPTSGLNINVTVEGDEHNKRYIFNNNGSQITLKRGSATLELPQNKTRFINENNKLKKLEEGNYGLPKDCEDNKSCILTTTDLETIKFSDFTEGDFSPFITVEGLTNKQTISLTIEDGKYIFTSPSSVTIKHNESSTVELGTGETEFKVEQGKLKKVVLGTLGLPEECEFQEGSNPTTCVLSSRDLKKIKFKVFDNNPTLSVPNNTEKITLKVEKVQDSSFPDGKKYTFTNSGSGDVTITNSSESSQSLTLSSGDNIFKKGRGGNSLVVLPKRTDPSDDVKALDDKIKDLGLPGSCTFSNKASGNEKSIECELTTEELKALKFSGGDVSEICRRSGDNNNSFGNDPITYKIKIEETKDEEQFKDQNIRVTFLNRGFNNSWSTDLVINFTSEGSAMTIADQTNTEFKINNQNKLEKAWSESNLSDLVGLKCPKTDGSSQDDCTLKNEGGSIKLFIDNQAKEFKPTNKSDIETNLSFETDKDNYNQGFKFILGAKITGTFEGGGESYELDKDSYEIRRINDHGWRFAEQAKDE